tara:strand:+ start:20613 stop:20936 length:324 start_codon:yes stop_codon:yes gene_type:complete
MSREFGNYIGGYFHDKVRNALEDLEQEAGTGFHKEFIPLFESLYEIAYAISSVEACDSSLDRSIRTTIEQLPKLKQTLKDLEDSVYPYQQVARNAVREYIREQEKKK